MLFFQFTTGQTRGALYNVLSGDAKLGRSYKLTSKILILMEFNLTQASSTMNSSNLILHQIFPLYGIALTANKGTIILHIRKIWY